MDNKEITENSVFAEDNKTGANKLNVKGISGMNDILPDSDAPFYAQSKNWMIIINKFIKMASDYGYEYIETPEVEKIELFKRTVGKSSDIVRKEMYTWEQGDDNLALRPEGSAATCRALVESGLLKRKSVVKVWYKGAMFRRERPQLGRYRRHVQLGIEFMGVDNAYADAEVISFLYKFYKSLGLKDIEVHLNSVGCVKCREAYKQKLVEAITPNIDKYCSDCKERLNINPMRILDCKVPECKELNVGLPSILDNLCDECKEHFEQLKKLLNSMNIEYILDSNLVRGLDYYSKTAFEILLKKAVGPIQTLSGGGRYDGLIEILSGENTPAVGCGIGIERLLLALERNGELKDGSRLSYFVVYVNDATKRAAFDILTLIRDNGHSAMMDYKGIRMKKQLSQAEGSKAVYALIIGETEYNEGKIIVKNMDSGTQCEISIDEFRKSLQNQ